VVITVVCDVFGDETNGTIVATMNLIRHLQNQGHKVRVLCADQSKVGIKDFYVCPSLNLGKWANAYIRKVGVTLAKVDQDIVEEAIKGADLVHIMIPFMLAMASVKVAKKLNIPITAGFHMQAENFTSYFKLNRFKPANYLVYHYIYRHVYRHVNAIHYPTRFIENIFESCIHKKTPGYVISNGVHDYVKKKEVEKPSKYTDKIVIMSIGRLAREKSQDTLIKAAKRSKYSDKIQLIFAGQGLKEKKYRRLARGLVNEPVFKLFSRPEVCDTLNYSDFYVHPADIELEGIACLEAIACGKMTIVSSSKRSATKEFVADEKCIFKSRRPKDLARILDYFIEHPEECRKYEEKYLNSSAVFSQNECMKKMENMMRKVVRESKKTA